jgi:hypothetical protein
LPVVGITAPTQNIDDGIGNLRIDRLAIYQPPILVIQ